MELWNRVETPLGEMLVVSDGTALTEVCFAEERVFQGDPAEIPVLQQANEWINIFFDGEDPGPIPPVAPKGSPFQHEVWEIVAKVPYGELITYGDIAVEIAAKRGILKMAAQAVGNAGVRGPDGPEDRPAPPGGARHAEIFLSGRHASQSLNKSRRSVVLSGTRLRYDNLEEKVFV